MGAQMPPTDLAWPWVIAAHVVSYALADRFVGGGAPKLDDALPGRSLFWAGLALIGLGVWLDGLAGGLLALLWAVQRCFDWDLFGGSIDPDPRQIPGTFLRHALPLPFALAIGLYCRLDLAHVGLALGGYALAATALAIAFREATKRGRDDLNTYVELCRGGAFGLARAMI